MRLRKWSSDAYKDRQGEIRKKSKRLKELQDREDPSVLEEIGELQKDIFTLIDQEDIRWMQRAKRHWYKYGDYNTKYFYACTNQ